MMATISDIISANAIFTKILSSEFTAKQSYVIAKLLKNINEEMESFNNAREELIIKYAEKDENGEVIITEGNAKIETEHLADFQNELNDLLYLEIELKGNKIPFEWLEKLTLTPQEILILEPFLDMED